MAIVLTEDVITRNGPSDGSVLSPEAVGLFLLTAVFIYIFESSSSKRPFTPSLTFKDCLTYSLLMTPINSLITGVVILIIPPLRDWFFLTYCIVFWICVWIDHYQSQKKQQARLSPANRLPQPASANYLTSPITAQSAPTRGAMQGVHPIGKLLLTLVGGGLLLVVSFYGTVWIFDYFDHTPKSREAFFMFFIVMGMIVFPPLFLFSRSEKNTQKRLSVPQPQHPSLYRPKPSVQQMTSTCAPAEPNAPQTAVEATPPKPTPSQPTAEASSDEPTVRQEVSQNIPDPTTPQTAVGATLSEQDEPTRQRRRPRRKSHTTRRCRRASRRAYPPQAMPDITKNEHEER